MASCADRLHQLQKDFGLTGKELKRACHEVFDPTEVKLPEFHVEPNKSEKERKKAEKKNHKKNKYFLAHWYLNKWLKPEYANEVYLEHRRFSDLVNYAYDQACYIIRIATFRIDTNLDPQELIPAEVPDNFDIPESQWDEFEKYCKKHPIEKASDIIKRREKFRDKRYKKRKKYYSRKNMRIYDPLLAATITDGKAMIKNIKRISAENEIRCQKFQEMVRNMIPDISKGSALLSKFNEQTEHILKTQRERLKEFMKNIEKPKQQLIFEMDDEPPVVYEY